MLLVIVVAPLELVQCLRADLVRRFRELGDRVIVEHFYRVVVIGGELGTEFLQSQQYFRFELAARARVDDAEL